MGNMDMNEVDHFMPIMMRMEEDADSSPLVTHGSAHFLWIKHRNLYRILSKQEFLLLLSQAVLVTKLLSLVPCSGRLSLLLTHHTSHNSQFTPSLHVLYLYISCYSEL